MKENQYKIQLLLFQRLGLSNIKYNLLCLQIIMWLPNIPRSIQLSFEDFQTFYLTTKTKLNNIILKNMRW